jgi:hypothetical protein
MKIVKCEFSKNGLCTDKNCYHYETHQIMKECDKSENKLDSCSLGILSSCVDPE